MEALETAPDCELSYTATALAGTLDETTGDEMVVRVLLVQ